MSVCGGLIRQRPDLWRGFAKNLIAQPDDAARGILRRTRRVDIESVGGIVADKLLSAGSCANRSDLFEQTSSNSPTDLGTEEAPLSSEKRTPRKQLTHRRAENIAAVAAGSSPCDSDVGKTTATSSVRFHDTTET